MGKEYPCFGNAIGVAEISEETSFVSTKSIKTSYVIFKFKQMPLLINDSLLSSVRKQSYCVLYSILCMHFFDIFEQKKIDLCSAARKYGRRHASKSNECN